MACEVTTLQCTAVIMLGVVVLTSASNLAVNLAFEYNQQYLNLHPLTGRFFSDQLLDASLPASALVGCLLSWLPLRYTGRRATLQLIVAPLITAGSGLIVIVHFTASTLLPILLLGIWLQGIAAGITFVAVPTYIMETIRHPIPALIISTQLSTAAGSLLARILVYFSASPYLPLLPAIIITVSGFCLSFVTESPRWLLLFGHKIEQAKESLHVLNKCNEPNYNLCKVLATYRKEEECCSRTTSKLIRTYLRVLLVSLCLLGMPCVCGVQVYDFYAGWVYKCVGFRTTNITLFSACERLIATSIMSIVVSAVGDLKSQCALLIILIGTSSIALGATSVCLFGLEHGENWTWAVPWLPLVIHLIFQTVYWFGPGSLAIILAFQCSPAPLRPSIMSLSGSLYWSLQVASPKFLVFMLNIIHPYGVFLFYAGTSAIALVLLVFVVVPEVNRTEDDDKSKRTQLL